MRYIELDDFLVSNHADRDKQDAANVLRNVVESVVRHEGADFGEYHQTCITYVWYPAGVGLKFHVDDMRTCLGPSLNIAVASDSAFDFIPLSNLKQSPHQPQPVRFLYPAGTAILLEETARWGYTHSIPYGQSFQYTDQDTGTRILGRLSLTIRFYNPWRYRLTYALYKRLFLTANTPPLT
jgi:hypothetical protein